MTGDGWSQPSFYAGGRPVAPPTMGGADPLSSFLFEDWSESAANYDGSWNGRWDGRGGGAGVVDSVDQWGATTYVGPRNLRPGTRPAAELLPDVGAGEEAVDERSNRGLLSNSRTMAIASLTSRITGFLRSILLVAALGTAAVGNSYSGGNTFPNMVYELLLGGVLSSVLIPLLVHAQEADDDDGIAYTQRLLSIATALLAVLTVIAVAAAPLIAGYFAKPEERHLTTQFAWLLLPEIFFYGIGAMFMAVLNIRHSYGPGMWAPVLNNVVMIVTVAIFFALPGPHTLTPATITTAQILVMGIGTTLGIVAQALVLIPALRRTGFRWRWRFRARPNEVGRMREVATLAGWVFAYVVASQVGVTVIQKIGFSNGGLTVFTQADLLFQVPYGILVVSLLTAIMPRMSRAAVRGANDEVIGDLGLASRLSAIAMVPITAGLIVLGPDLGILLFGHGESSIARGRLIGSSLAYSAFGLLFFAIVMLQLRVFYAMRDGRTPTLINVFMVATKVVLVLATNAAFHVAHGVNANVHPNPAAVEWLNIATSLSYVVGAVVGHVVLTRRLGRLGYRSVLVTTIRIAVASAVGALVAYVVVVGCRHGFGDGFAGAAGGLVLGGLAGLVVMLLIGLRMRIPELRDLAGMARSRA